jgi:ABC-2 type transport system permease protein
VIPYAQIANIAVTISVFLTGLAFLFVAASFIGAEYSSGALANWLSFVPERGKVFTSKLLAVVIAAAVVNAAASALTIALAALVTRAAHAQVAGVGKIVQTGGRGVVIGVICAILGYGLAMLTRHTIAAAGTVLAYLFVSSVLSGLSQVIAPLQKIRPFQAETNALAFLNHGYAYTTYVDVATPEGVTQQAVRHMVSFAHSAGYWSIIVVVVVAVALMIFRRRDLN